MSETIYLVVTESDYYGAYTPIAAFRDDADANQLVTDGIGSEVLAVDLHDGPIPVRPWYRSSWRADCDHHDRPPVGMEPQIALGSGESTHEDWGLFGYKHGVRRRIAGFSIGSWDREELLRMYHEHRAVGLQKQEEYDRLWKIEWRTPKDKRPSQPYVSFKVIG